MIIEIDGSSHIAKYVENYERQVYLEKLGYKFLRFPEGLVIYRIDEVIAEIDYAIECIEEQMSL